MAKLAPGIEFTGSLGRFTAYKRKDLKDIILREKGGPSRQQIQTLDSCAPVRRNNSEFGGVSRLAAKINRVLHPMIVLSDFNLNAELLKQLKPLLELDNTSVHGQRNVLLSMSPHVLNGFQLNGRNPFESVVRNPLSFSLVKESLSATIETPALRQGMNFFPIGNLPVYRWIVSFGLIPDMLFDDAKGYVAAGEDEQILSSFKYTDWFAIAEPGSPLTIELNIPVNPVEASFSLLLAVGISFGMIHPGAEIKPVKYCGAGKVIGMA